MLFLVTVGFWLHDHNGLLPSFAVTEDEYHSALYRIFLCVLGGAVVAYGLGWTVGLRRLTSALKLPRVAVSPRETLVLLEAFTPRSIVASKLASAEAPSVLLPLVAQSLLGVVTVHFGVLLLLTCSCCGYAYAGLAGFGHIIALDELYLGLAHLAWSP